MANAQHSVAKMKVLSAMINDQWYAMEWSELLCQLDSGMKVHETNDLIKLIAYDLYLVLHPNVPPFI